MTDLFQASMQTPIQRWLLLTLWQPHASLCVLPHHDLGRPPKRFETRHWNPSRRQPPPFHIAIHAAAKYGGEQMHDCLALKNVMGGCGITWVRGRSYADDKPDIPFGKIVGVATVIAIYPTNQIPPHIFRDPITKQCGDFSPGRYAFHLEDARPLPDPIPLKGRQDTLWTLPVDVDIAINRQLGIPDGTSS